MQHSTRKIHSATCLVRVGPCFGVPHGRIQSVAIELICPKQCPAFWTTKLYWQAVSSMNCECHENKGNVHMCVRHRKECGSTEHRVLLRRAECAKPRPRGLRCQDEFAVMMLVSAFDRGVTPGANVVVPCQAGSGAGCAGCGLGRAQCGVARV